TPRRPARAAAQPDPSALARAREAARALLERFRVPVGRRPERRGPRATVEAQAEVVFEDAQFWLVDPARPPLLVLVGEDGRVWAWEQARPLQFFLWLLTCAGTVVLARSPGRPRPAPPATDPEPPRPTAPRGDEANGET
ncbi:MAG: hypothetical protein D6731_08945, partial [Planctomycetota bacterium]